jgi:hypothetical protein
MEYLPAFSPADTRSYARKGLVSRLIKPLVLSALLAVANLAYAAQPANRITAPVDLAQVRALPNHHPLWANAANDAGLAPADLPLENMTLVLARSPQQEADFAQLLADQQNPASAEYHHWLTPAEVGERFGLSAQDIDTLSSWLQSQGLHVNWVAPSRTFIGFGGTAANLGRAFQTELHYYNVNGVKRMSVASDPMIPQALAPAIKAIRGLYTLEEQPYSHAAVVQSASPQTTTTSGNHYVAPADFATIYDLPSSYTGYGMTIGIVGRSRTDFADFSNFKLRTGDNFQSPTEIVPTAYGGIDPGPALTAPPTGGASFGDQGEATLDVLRAGSVAPNANLLLVVATSASGGIGVDTQYLVQTSPLPAQVITISFGACESAAGASSVSFWDTLFQQAAAEGISVFVSSGDAGASGCDTNFSTPPAAPKANSPNYICSSSYATCVGGTEFNDTSNPTSYWSSSNASNLSSALSYIPEGGWNEPLNSSSLPEAASSGGGVSAVIATPSWQTGTGVPAARAGRYTPDISFSSSCHDGYFGCFAAGGASCTTGTNGMYTFEYFCGTSAAAPAMAGVTALLDANLGLAQGNLNPEIYQMAASAPTAFHDVTVATSGVASCDVNTPSMCNNSIPSSTGLSGGQAGFLVTAGYDEVTGLGSLDVVNFLNHYATPPIIKTPGVTSGMTFPSQLIGFSWTGQLGVQNSGTTTMNPVTVAITGTNAGDFSQSNDCQQTVGPGSVCAVQVTFKPTAVGTRAATLTLTASNAINSPLAVPLSGIGSSTQLVPQVTVSPSLNTPTVAQSITAQIQVWAPQGGYPTPTGSVTLTSGSFASAATALVSGSATIPVPAGALATGTDALIATFTPDAASSSVYSSATGSVSILVTSLVAPSFTITAPSLTLTAGATTGNFSIITVTPSGGFTGGVALTAVLTSSPANGTYPPTFSFGTTSPVSITGGGNGAAQLTITTTASQTQSCTADNRMPRGIPWHAEGGMALALVLLFGIPARRRKVRNLLGMVALAIVLVSGVASCGGGGSGTKVCPTAILPGTTPGAYVVTVTGTSGTTKATGTVNLTVQ